MISQTILNTIKDTAYRVRYFGELFQKSHPCTYTIELTGMCGICSYFLFKTLKEKKLSPVFSINDEHCFVMLQGLVIDVTATQFYLKDKIFIKKLPHPTGNWIVMKMRYLIYLEVGILRKILLNKYREIF